VPDGEFPLTEKESKGIKIHLGALLGTLVQPISGTVAPDNVNDSTEFDNLLRDIASVERLEDIILVFDKGYTNYERYNSFLIRRVLFVAPLKKNAKFEILSSIDYTNYAEHRILLDGMNFVY
jgi:transposase